MLCPRCRALIPNLQAGLSRRFRSVPAVGSPLSVPSPAVPLDMLCPRCLSAALSLCPRCLSATMARPSRAEVFDPNEVAIAHVFNRTVRRCFLMGDDALDMLCPRCPAAVSPLSRLICSVLSPDPILFPERLKAATSTPSSRGGPACGQCPAGALALASRRIARGSGP